MPDCSTRIPHSRIPDSIILDDAHSAEQYIADSWTLRIRKNDPRAQTVWMPLCGILRRVLPHADYRRVDPDETAEHDTKWSDLIPTPIIEPLLDEIVSLISHHIGDDINNKLRFPWFRISDHIRACNVFVGSGEIVFRPYIPPTREFRPFSNAKQRIYMSATLGSGGELERLTGRRVITRIQPPKSHDKMAIGRRLFMFPSRSLPQQGEDESVALQIMREAGRSLVLVPSEARAEHFRALVQDELGFKTFSADEIEKSKDAFVDHTAAVAIMANRYDGIDFPDDDCRVLVLDGLPNATNLQERFLINRMDSTAILADRIRTRIVQAVGRCTRSDQDYSAVIVLGDALATYLTKREGRAHLDPELQAELEFGLKESKDRSADEFIENWRIFQGQDTAEFASDWSDANQEILSLRATRLQKPLPTVEALAEDRRRGSPISGRHLARGLRRGARAVPRHPPASKRRGASRIPRFLVLPRRVRRLASVQARPSGARRRCAAVFRLGG